MTAQFSITEEKIKEIWKALLSVDEVEPSQTFFDLGGDSLLMIDMFMVVNQVFEIEVDPGSLFEDASLRGFAKYVDLAGTGMNDVERGAV